jgi:hypothetical protein
MEVDNEEENEENETLKLSHKILWFAKNKRLNKTILTVLCLTLKLFWNWMNWGPKNTTKTKIFIFHWTMDHWFSGGWKVVPWSMVHGTTFCPICTSCLIYQNNILSIKHRTNQYLFNTLNFVMCCLSCIVMSNTYICRSNKEQHKINFALYDVWWQKYYFGILNDLSR